MQLAVAFALVLAVVRRDRVWLTLAGAAALWVAIEIAFAYHGWSAVGRYLIEPAAVLVVLAGAAVGRALAYRPGGTSPLRWAPTALVLCLVVALIPAARSRARSTHQAIDEAHQGATRLSRLEAVIARNGGPARIKACGQPVTALVYQSELAWAIGLNVGQVGYRLGESIQKGVPIVLFTPDGDGWKVRPINTLRPSGRLRPARDSGGRPPRRHWRSRPFRMRHGAATCFNLLEPMLAMAIGDDAIDRDR